MPVRGFHLARAASGLQDEPMKLSITYLYTIFKYGYPPKPADDFKALADIEKMGFHYLEMEALGPQHAEQDTNNRHGSHL